MKTTALAALLALGCSSAASPVVTPVIDAAVDARGDDVTLALDVPAPEHASCTRPIELVAGRAWSVSPAADGVAPPCSGASNVGPIAWARVEVPAHMVLRLRVPDEDAAAPIRIKAG